MDDRSGPMTEFLDLIKTYEQMSHSNEITSLLSGNNKITVFVPTSEVKDLRGFMDVFWKNLVENTLFQIQLY